MDEFRDSNWGVVHIIIVDDIECSNLRMENFTMRGPPGSSGATLRTSPVRSGCLETWFEMDSMVVSCATRTQCCDWLIMPLMILHQNWQTGQALKHFVLIRYTVFMLLPKKKKNLDEWDKRSYDGKLLSWHFHGTSTELEILYSHEPFHLCPSSWMTQGLIVS